jgi:succinylglutamate desuccinylase
MQFPQRASASVVRRAAVVFGTHGNEFTGTFVAHQLRERKILEQYPSLDLSLVHANPRAYREV